MLPPPLRPGGEPPGSAGPPRPGSITDLLPRPFLDHFAHALPSFPESPILSATFPPPPASGNRAPGTARSALHGSLTGLPDPLLGHAAESFPHHLGIPIPIATLPAPLSFPIASGFLATLPIPLPSTFALRFLAMVPIPVPFLPMSTFAVLPVSLPVGVGAACHGQQHRVLPLQAELLSQGSRKAGLQPGGIRPRGRDRHQGSRKHGREQKRAEQQAFHSVGCKTGLGDRGLPTGQEFKRPAGACPPPIARALLSPGPLQQSGSLPIDAWPRIPSFLGRIPDPAGRPGNPEALAMLSGGGGFRGPSVQLPDAPIRHSVPDLPARKENGSTACRIRLDRRARPPVRLIELSRPCAPAPPDLPDPGKGRGGKVRRPCEGKVPGMHGRTMAPGLGAAIRKTSSGESPSPASCCHPGALGGSRSPAGAQGRYMHADRRRLPGRFRSQPAFGVHRPAPLP